MLPAITAISLAFVGAMVLKDLLTATREGYHFYFSESLLFSSVWLYFPPVALFVRRLTEKSSMKQMSTARKYASAVALAVTIHACLYAAGVFILSFVFFDHSYSFVGNLGYTLSSDIFAYILVYAGLAFLHWQSMPREKAEPAAPLEKLPVTDGRVTTMLDVAGITFVQSSDPYISIYIGTKRYLHKESLRSMEQRLGEGFARVHRSTIVNVQKVVAVNSRGNGDFDIVMDGGQTVRLSRNYVQSFRQRMGMRPSA